MAYPTKRTFDTIRVWAHLADVSTAGSAFAVAPCRGRIINMGSVIYNAITTANGAITSKIAGTLITGGSWTITQSGSAAGDVDSAIPTAARDVNEGDNIEFISDGACDTTCPTMFFADIRPTI